MEGTFFLLEAVLKWLPNFIIADLSRLFFRRKKERSGTFYVTDDASYDYQRKLLKGQRPAWISDTIL